jgi:hypothetical protein
LLELLDVSVLPGSKMLLEVREGLLRLPAACKLDELLETKLNLQCALLKCYTGNLISGKGRREP